MKLVRRKNKYGSGTVFIAIILAAVVIVECTYLAFVIDLDRRMNVARALKCEAESILAGYDRDLLAMYGLYGFDAGEVDDKVFRDVLDPGIGDMELTLDKVYTIDNDSLDKAIASYYAYRTIGISTTVFAEQFKPILEELDKSGVIGKIKEYRESGAAPYVQEILEGAGDVGSYLEDNDDIDLSGLKNITSLIDDSKDDVTDLGTGSDVFDLDLFTENISRLETLSDMVSDKASGNTDHPLIAHYAAYNFDCYLENGSDPSIICIDFGKIHGSEEYDSENILMGTTGKGGSVGVAAVCTFALHVISSVKFLEIYLNTEKRQQYKNIAEAVAVILAAVSDGTIDINPDVLMVIMIITVAMCKGFKEAKKVRNGEKVPLLEIKGKEYVYLGYRDFMYALMLLVPDGLLLKRMNKTLVKDFGVFGTGIRVKTRYRGTDYDYTDTYELYG